MKIDIQDIKLVAVIARTGSITAGAAAINLALASASERLRTLENGLGIALFERAARGVTTTVAGEAFLRHALPIISHHDALRREVTEFAQGTRRRIRIAANSIAVTQLLSEPLTDFLLAHPKVNVAVNEMPTERSLAAVLNGDADLGIGVLRGSFANLDVLPLMNETIVAVMSADHSLAGKAVVSFNELLDHELLSVGASSALQQFLQDRADELGKAFRRRAFMRDGETICRMAARGVAAGIVFSSVAARCRESSSFSIVPISDPWSLREVSAFWSREKPPDGALNELVAMLARPAPPPPRTETP